MTPELKLQALKTLTAFLKAPANKNKTIDGYKLALAFNTEYKTHLDWHEFSAFLDWLHTIGLLTHAGFNSDGMTQYSF